jgi:UDP-N-acetylglucosamine--N-acetylmuramyl-(pentapeptide) pyrophosphoryl-undecaprenol N-acetylglucosamine transferase
MSLKVLIMAAGTGGHVFPGLAVASCLQHKGAQVRWLGTPHGLENRLVPKAGIELTAIDIAGVRGKGVTGWLALPGRVVGAMVAAWRAFRQDRPDVVISMGGYVAGPGGLVAKLMGIPLILHEQNAIAGLTNRWLAPWAAKIFTGFPGVFKRGVCVGNPVRADIASLDQPQLRWQDRAGPVRVLIIGGSLGARIFAERIPQALAQLPAGTSLQITHQAGRVLDEAKAHYAKVTLPEGVAVELVEFIDDMAAAWAHADVAITRSGALTVAELAAAGVGALLVPFALAVDDHQSANAAFLSDAGAAWLLPETAATVERLAQWFGELDREALLQRAVRARALARTDAAEHVAEACWAVAA